MEDRVKEIIVDWLRKEFKNEEALPDIVVSGLADEIDRHGPELHRIIQREYDKEDLDYILEGMEVELTDSEKEQILDAYENREDNALDYLRDIVDYVIRRKKLKEVHDK